MAHVGSAELVSLWREEMGGGGIKAMYFIGMLGGLIR